MAYLSEGAKVIPHHELIRQANYYVMKDIASGGNNKQQDHVMKEFLKQNLSVSKNIERNISRMRNNTTIQIDGSHNNYLINKFNR